MPYDKCTRQEFEAKNYTFNDEDTIDEVILHRYCPKNYDKIKMENSYSNLKNRKSVSIEVHLKLGDDELY